MNIGSFKMKKEISIVWFRQDLRLSDNPTLEAASQVGEILPIYILDDCAPPLFKMGSASKIWLHHSLLKLNESLNGNLNLYIGKACDIIKSLIERYEVKTVFWNKCYEPWHLDQENDVMVGCDQTSTKWEAFNANYLWSPRDVIKDDGGYYKVFTAYKRKSYFLIPRICVDTPKSLNLVRDSSYRRHLLDLGLIPIHKWHQSIEESWDIGEEAAQQKLTHFIENLLSGYKEGRDYPAKEQTSKLSPHLHFGEISASQIWHAIQHYGRLCASENDIEHFSSELLWREFSCYLLYHFNTLYKDNFNPKFDHFDWENNPIFLKAWQMGNTGYPLIDAGMRQLWKTGYMHNRVRMVVASFLVKNLNIHWHKGRDWFWDCLVDADLANNSASWQWVAGCGVDAAPYFRIFNPTTQGEKFDAHGEYTREFVPELRNMPNKYLFRPWEAPETILQSAGVVLGKTYPKPIVDFVDSRMRALHRYRYK